MHFVLTLLLLSGSAQSPVPGPHWQCDATGVSAGGVSRTVTGEFRASQALAEQSALEACAREGLGGCMVGFCFDDGLGLSHVAGRIL